MDKYLQSRYPYAAQLFEAMTAGLDEWFYARQLRAAKRRNSILMAFTVLVFIAMGISANATTEPKPIETDEYSMVCVAGLNISSPVRLSEGVNAVLHIDE
ncbi:MAG: hypothetical protein K6F85_03555 [Bacteroidales bacterium]|nr:hypothetical protein [Bacteroidales bacterium]